jgi:hypothetical protein
LKKLLVSFLILLLMLTVTASCWAQVDVVGDSPHFGIGYQITRPASGFSVKIPIKNNYYLQPTLSYSLVEKKDSVNGHLAMGLRGIAFLPTQSDFHPYAGLSWGYSENFAGNALETTTVIKGGNGYEAFLGVEYQRYALRPALEIGMGTYANIDGSYYAGAVVNFSLVYYF